MSEIVAALDAGTNTLRLLVAEAGPDGRLIEHDRQLRFVGLGQGVDATGRFADEAVARAFAAIDEYAPIVARTGASRARFVATSASRDAANREEFFAGVRARLGIEPELISGDEEAQLSFVGALSGAALAPDGAVLVMDSGGGSTELVRGDASAKIAGAISIDVGSRRIRERYLRFDPPSAEQIAAARAEVNRLLDASPVDLAGIGSFIGVAGTVTSMAALALGQQSYDRKAVHGSRMSVEKVGWLTEYLLSIPVAELAALGPVAPERAQVLCAGALVVNEVTRRVGVDLQASEADILDGLVFSMLRQGKGQRLR